MSIVARFMTAVAEPQFKLARDLTAIAIADGKLTPEEKEALCTVCHLEGIDEAQLIENLKPQDNIDDEMPATRKEKEEYLRDLIRIISADKYCAPQEVYIFQIIASKMGLNQMEVIGLFLLTATHRYFQGDTGAKVLASFLKSVIDPKGKKDAENRDNLRIIYETIAQNTGVLENREADRELLRQNLARATKMLIENKILIKEFADIGCDFPSMLKQEEQIIFKRYAG